MSNAKEKYSTSASEYVTGMTTASNKAKERYERSKKKKEQYSKNWKEQKININELTDKYTPGVEPKVSGSKMIWKNEKYEIKADLGVGSARVFDRKLKNYLDINGDPCNNNDLTHFGIKKKEEM
ncbi:hypothetical protein [Fibrobacter sp. UWEL]|uniref:hypothetical protein n=1 Tax=Fibrobacter sp. UWEL TaxID=1896209 RepID=UPI000919E58C|nr:hypothetical protein [Fibrobacter sp. UWEL]SHK75066.1 hypothetical protein SAMN05720468_10673 [Fibrobacter sp. UWEL]